ncbi:methionine gamma-lyase family protein, partial [Bacillus safensis]
MFHTLKHGSILEKAAAETEQEILHVHQQIDQKSEQNEWRVLESYRKHKVSDS